MIFRNHLSEFTRDMFDVKQSTNTLMEDQEVPCISFYGGYAIQ